jgi:hypothetical protein
MKKRFLLNFPYSTFRNVNAIKTLKLLHCNKIPLKIIHSVLKLKWQDSPNIWMIILKDQI